MQKPSLSKIADTLTAPFRKGWKAIKDAKQKNETILRLEENFNAAAAKPDAAEQALALLKLLDDNSAAAEAQRETYKKMTLPVIGVALVGSLAAGLAFSTLIPFLGFGLFAMAALTAEQELEARDASLKAHAALDKKSRDTGRDMLNGVGIMALSASPHFAELADRAPTLKTSFADAIEQAAAKVALPSPHQAIFGKDAPKNV